MSKAKPSTRVREKIVCATSDRNAFNPHCVSRYWPRRTKAVEGVHDPTADLAEPASRHERPGLGVLARPDDDVPPLLHPVQEPSTCSASS